MKEGTKRGSGAGTRWVGVGTAPNSNEAEFLAARLRRAGLHPADVPLVTPFPAEDGKVAFPIEVPNEEADAAKEILKSHSCSHGTG